MKPFAVILLLVIAASCNGQPDKSKYKVAILKYSHETCTFCPGGDTEIDDWLKASPLITAEELFASGSYVRGFVSQARSFGDIDLVGLRSPNGVFGGSSRSWNSEESFDHFLGIMIEDLRAELPVDGVYLALHGAMAVRNVARPEAEIARRIREVVGEGVPIVGTFDLHGNEDAEFLKWANGAFVTKRFPHYDSYLQGERAARYMRSIMLGDFRPTTSTRKPAIITPTVVQWTGQSPAMDIMERARRWEARHPDVFVSVFFGFPWSDVPDVGACVHVMTNDQQDLADSIAADMNDYFWRVREALVKRAYPMPEEAVSLTKKAIESGQTPVALGDYSDRPGDATWILKELQDQGIRKFAYGALTDINFLTMLTEKDGQVGDPIDELMGGYTGPQAGQPVRVQGTLEYFDEMWSYDKVAVVRTPEDNVIIVVPAYTQLIYPAQFRFGGIEPQEFDVFVVKSRVHFRRGFDETGFAKTIMVVDAPGSWFGTTRLDALDYKNAPITELYPYNSK